MSAERLRGAAELLRRRATLARSGRWFADGTEIAAKWMNDDRPVASTRDGSPVHDGRIANAKYIATVDPAFGLAVAEWLDAVAARVEEIHESLPFSTRLTITSLNVTAVEQALAVADAVLGDAS